MSSFFHKYADKAQSAINQTPLAAYIPPQYQQHPGGGAPPTEGAPATGTAPQPGSTATPPPTQGQQTTPPQQPQPRPPVNATTITPANTSVNVANPPTGQGQGVPSGSTGVAGMLKQHGFSSLQNQLRSLQIQHSKGPDRQIKLAITAQKSVALSFEAAGRDSQVYSKELYLWGQEQAEDIKDVTDRLAYLNFVHGQLSTDLSKQLEASRMPFKTARATESTSETLKDAGRGSTEVDNEAAIEQRNALKEGEAARWKALREYAEKLILLTQAGEVIIGECLPAADSSTPYGAQAKQRTAEVRSILQKSLDNWHLHPAIASTSPFVQGKANPLDPRSFGETHRQELDRTPSFLERQRADQEILEAHTSRPAGPAPVASGGSGPQSTGVNPAQLNNAPAPVPAHGSSGTTPTTSTGPLGGVGSPTVPPTAPLNLSGKKPGSSPSSQGFSGIIAGAGTGAAVAGAAHSASNISTAPSSSANTNIPGSPNASTVASHPTVAETGVPISSSGSGPSSGSLLSSPPPADISKADVGSPTWTGPVQGGPGGFRDPRDVGPPGTSQAVKYETAEEEKKRLEREDRDRLLRFGTGANASQGTSAPRTEPPASNVDLGRATSSASTGPAPPPKNETAEEEKKRLAREERERLLRGQDPRDDGSGPSGGGNGGPDDGNDLPAHKPY